MVFEMRAVDNKSPVANSVRKPAESRLVTWAAVVEDEESVFSLDTSGKSSDNWTKHLAI